jgi:lysophospholipase L1-like esterase
MIWYEDEVHQLERALTTLSPANNRVVFYGSSSVRLWQTVAQDFPQRNTLNLGFGGSTMAACGWFFERLLVPAKPASVVFYAGDNDLGDGRHPEEVLLFFIALMHKMQRYLPGVPLTFLSIKVSPARWNLRDDIQRTNNLIRAEIANWPTAHFVDMTTPLLDSQAGIPQRVYFQADGLHLSPAGYAAWRDVLLPKQMQI